MTQLPAWVNLPRMKWRTSVADLERRFHRHAQAQAIESEELLIEVGQRSERRRRERTHKAGWLRFWMLVLILVATAVLVTIVMFQTLYYVMG